MDDWTVMNDLESSFNNIIAFECMLEELQDAIQCNDMVRVKQTHVAMQSYYKVYTSQWDRSFKTAWTHVIKKAQ